MRSVEETEGYVPGTAPVTPGVVDRLNTYASL